MAAEDVMSKVEAAALSTERRTPAGAPDLLSVRSERIMWVAFLSFLSFSIVELIYGISSHSLALVGDAAAMIIDSFTYLGNGVALRLARRGQTSATIEVMPAVSALSLALLVIYIGVVAIQMLADPHPGASEVDMTVVLGFGAANLLIDVANLFLFWRYPNALRAVLTFTDPESLQADGGLNIRSALCHVVGDTWRSLAVVVAAIVADASPTVSPANADAVAALAVQVPILIMVAHLLNAVRQKQRRVLVPPHEEADATTMTTTAPFHSSAVSA